ncbi:MAG: RMD1 family protein [Betaproteobacteria bacterium]|nr:RMD1 family protein [Betaproteobacteria bacterium]
MAQSRGIDKKAFAAHAVLIGERIDLRAWKTADALSTSPLTVAVREGGIAILFRFGVVVFFDVSATAQAVFLDDIKRFVGNPYGTPETAKVEVRTEPGAREGMAGDTVTVDSGAVERMQLIADVLSKSVVLAWYESQVAANFDRVEPLARDLERTGRVSGHVKELLKYIGTMLLTQQLMVGRVAISDKPEILWERPDLEGLFLRLVSIVVRERLNELERKINLVARTAETLLQLIHSRHSLRVEWYIVILIVAEILLTVYAMVYGL